ncbi:MAG: VOC family protein [Planctomycetota bacterium]
MPSTIQFKKLDHVTLIVADLARSREFFKEVLGLFELPRPEFDFEGLWFGTEQPSPGKTVRAEIHLTLQGELAGEAGWGNRKVKRLSRGHHIALQVEDAHAAAQWLNSKGVQLDDGPKKRPDGPVQIFLRDPDNHVIELFSIA